MHVLRREVPGKKRCWGGGGPHVRRTTSRRWRTAGWRCLTMLSWHCSCCDRSFPRHPRLVHTRWCWCRRFTASSRTAPLSTASSTRPCASRRSASSGQPASSRVRSRSCLFMQCCYRARCVLHIDPVCDERECRKRPRADLHTGIAEWWGM